MTKQPVIIHLRTDRIKVDLVKVRRGADFERPEALVDRVLEVRRQIERILNNEFRDLKGYVMIPGGEETISIDVFVDVSIKDFAKIEQLPNKSPKAISIKYGGAYHKILDSAYYSKDGTIKESKGVSRLMVEGLLTSTGTLTSTGQDVFDQLARMALDNEEFEIFQTLLGIVKHKLCMKLIVRTLELSSWVLFDSTVGSSRRRRSKSKWQITQQGDKWLGEHVLKYINDLNDDYLTAVAVTYLPVEALPSYISSTKLSIRKAAEERATTLGL